MTHSKVTKEGMSPFSLGDGQVRGRLIRIDETLNTILEKHAYPYVVGALLAETLTVVAALSSNLKFDGIFSVSIQSDGPISLLVADTTSEGHMRGYAQFDAKKVGDIKAVHPGLRFRKLLKEGRLVFTLDQGPNTDRYQGIVSLTGHNLTEVFQNYFTQSEQLDTLLKTAVRFVNDHWQSSALLLQKIPRGDDPSLEEEDPLWAEVSIFTQTLQEEELLDFDTPCEKLIDRLFREFKPEIYDHRSIKAQCRCSQGRVVSLLRTFPAEEIEGMKENGKIIVTCQFCSTTYVLNDVDFQLKIVD
jgi:molecular chaperone Hsp33